MPAVSSTSPTGDASIDAVLSGTQWATVSLSFSFPSDSSLYGASYGGGEPLNNFETFTTQQQDAVRSILKTYSSVTNLTFTEVTETSTVHADLRFAESDAPTTAWAYYPSTSSYGGDAWFNNSKDWYDQPDEGNYAFLTMLHEIGHALGLKHPHEVKGAFGAMPLDHDSLEYSVMSYRSYVGATTTGGYTNVQGSYPQTLMMYDIAALQAMYGANYNANSGNTSYSWSATTGEMFVDGVGQGSPCANKIFMTIWDGGGRDVYNFSNYSTTLQVNLQPGAWTVTSSVQLADLNAYAPGTKLAVGNIANALLYHDNPFSLIEDVIGGWGDDTIVGNIADNTFTGGHGNDVLDGGAGSDTATYSGAFSDYNWLQNADGSWTLTELGLGSVDGIDTLWNIEFLQFSDMLVAIETPSPPNVVINSAPVATDDVYVTSKNTKLVVNGAGVLSNDVDVDGDLLSAILVNDPSRGTLGLNADGSFIYSPNRNFTGSDFFTYRVYDETGAFDLATVSITVLGGQGSGGGRGKGGGAGQIDLWDDQIPAPAGGSESIAKFSFPEDHGLVVAPNLSGEFALEDRELRSVSDLLWL